MVHEPFGLLLREGEDAAASMAAAAVYSLMMTGFGPGL